MGKILRQSFWSTIIIYSGVVLGFINSIILFPKYLSTEQIGLFRQIISASSLLVPLTTFGVSAAYVKFYPLFKENVDKKNQFFSYNLLVVFSSYLLTTFLIIFFFDSLSIYFSQNSQLFLDYFYLVYFIVFVMSLSALFESYLRARYDIVLSNIINGVSNRFFTAVSIILLALSVLTFDEVINLQILIYGIGLIIIISYSYRKDKFKFQLKYDKISSEIKKILNFSSFSFLGSFSNILVLNVDILMVTSLLGLSQTGIYTTAFYIGMIIEIPRRAISQISIPFISENIKNNNIKNLEKNYTEVSLYQTIIGVLFYLLIIINLDSLFSLIPNSENFISGKDVVYVVGMSKLIIMIFGYSSELISLSKYYKFNVVTILILAVVGIILNIILIPVYGLIGAAMASLISIIIFNIIKFIFIKIKFGISPFTSKTLKVITLGFILFLIFTYYPIDFDNKIFEILVKSILIILLFSISIFYMKISKKVNEIVKGKINL